MKTIRYKTLAHAALFYALALTASPCHANEPILLHPKNEKTIGAEHIRSMLTGSERFWDNGQEVLIAVLKNDPAAERALIRYSGMTASKFKNHWQRIAFSGRGKMPKQFNNIEEIQEFVKRTPGALAIIGDSSTISGSG